MSDEEKQLSQKTSHSCPLHTIEGAIGMAVATRGREWGEPGAGWDMVGVGLNG